MKSQWTMPFVHISVTIRAKSFIFMIKAPLFFKDLLGITEDMATNFAEMLIGN